MEDYLPVNVDIGMVGGILAVYHLFYWRKLWETLEFTILLLLVY